MIGSLTHEFEQAPKDGEGQGSLACCSPWSRKESDTNLQLNNMHFSSMCFFFSKFEFWRKYPNNKVVKNCYVKYT